MSKSKYKINDKVMIAKNETLYPKSHHLMGVVTKISNNDDNFMYDIHYGITDIPDEKNVHEEDLKLYE